MSQTRAKCAGKANLASVVWNISTGASHSPCRIWKQRWLLIPHTHTGKNCCCSKRTLTERRRNYRVSAKSCSQSSSRFPKTSRRSVANHLEPLNHKILDGCVMFVFQSQDMVSTLESALNKLQTEHEALKLQQEKVWLVVIVSQRVKTELPVISSEKGRFFVNYILKQSQTVTVHW